MTSLSEKLNYAGWEMQGQDIDEDEEDAEMDVGGEEEEEEEDEAEEVNLFYDLDDVTCSITSRFPK